jgi:hypothetical protein
VPPSPMPRGCRPGAVHLSAEGDHHGTGHPVVDTDRCGSQSRGAATQVLGSATPAERSPKVEASVRIDLGIALVHLGLLDEAAAYGSQVKHI